LVLPEVFVTFARQKFDDKGRLSDRKTKQLIRQLLEILVDWGERLKERGESYK
jgi:hypothetical protein